MRIDKFLWCVRYYKTRNLATNACKKGQVRINEHIAKPGREVYPQDKIALRKNQINYSLVVNDIPTSRVGAKLVDIYRTDTTPKDEFKAQDMLRSARDHYRKKGVGRPTKKDRRDIDEFYDENE